MLCPISCMCGHKASLHGEKVGKCNKVNFFEIRKLMFLAMRASANHTSDLESMTERGVFFPIAGIHKRKAS